MGPYVDPSTGDLNCPKPANAWSLAAWLDYERCVLEEYVWWGPGQQATAQAIPTLFAGKEPFYTIGQVRSIVGGMQTEVATVQWGNTGMSGVNDPINTDPRYILKQLNPGQNDPWSGVGKFTINLGSSNPAITTYCSNQLSGFFSKYLGDGLCYVLNLAMAIGYLPWVQLLVNLLAILGIVKQALGLIGYFSGNGKGTQYANIISQNFSGSEEGAADGAAVIEE